MLLRQNTVDFAAGNVWEYAPQDQTSRLPGVLRAARGTQSLHTFPAGWGTQATKLQGNYAHVYTDVDDNNVPDTAVRQLPGVRRDRARTQAGPNWNYALPGRTRTRAT